MATPVYDIILTGKLLEATTREQAVQRLAALFKVSAEQAAKLVDGKPHFVKKGVGEETARKFKAALTKAGLQTVARAQASTAGAPEKKSTPATPIAATPAGDSLSLAPEGTLVLKPDERSEVHAPQLDLSGISLAEMETWEGSHKPATEAIEVPEFGLAPAGADIETLPDRREKLHPDVSQLQLDEPGATLGPPPKAPPPAPDTSHIKLERANPFL